jgi:DNA polymerase V
MSSGSWSGSVSAVFALVDGNNFYASCEQVFQPALRERPLVVLSNNDGCAIARCAQAKALGIAMGQPAHQLKEYVQRFGLQMRSANFGLYGDMSARVVETLREFSRRIEVYSIDESFLDLSGIRDRESLGQDIRFTVKQWTGIPCCVGIGPTKTLAKLANKWAKKHGGVIDVSNASERERILAQFPVDDLWGVGRKWSVKLNQRGIFTAQDLAQAPPDDLLKAFGVVMTRTQRELQGRPCIGLEEQEPDRQQILVSRSFGKRVESHAEIQQAAATFAIRACEKLRKRGLVATGVWLFAHTDAFRPELPQHHPSRAMTLPVATSDSRIVLQAVRNLFRGFLRKSYGYKKCGVALLDLSRPENLQHDLFQAPTAGNEALMNALDAINRKFGRNSAGFAASGWKQAPSWGMRQKNVSPHYTTKWTELPRANC